MLLVILAITAAVSLGLAGVFGLRLYRWEVLLTRARVKVYFKGKAAMTPRLLDLLAWTNRLQKDRNVNGQVIYKQGGTTIALTRAHKRVPKPKQTTRKEGEQTWIHRMARDLLRGFRRQNGEHSKSKHEKTMPPSIM